MSRGHFCYRESKLEASEQGSTHNPHKGKNFRFLPTMHLDFLTTMQRIFTTIPCTLIAFIYRTLMCRDEFLFYVKLS